MPIVPRITFYQYSASLSCVVWHKSITFAWFFSRLITMNGLYIHVPFCKSRCAYCDFYSTTLGEQKREAYVRSLCNEMSLRASYLPSKHLSSIYWGGGTPSLLSVRQLDTVFQTIYKLFSVDSHAEITLEANPDDMAPEYVSALRSLPINRLSLGLQTFNNTILKLLHRRHTADEARFAVKCLQDAGYENLSIDLIYGLPFQSVENWNFDVTQALYLEVCHLSAYALSYEEGTLLWKMLQQGSLQETSEQESWQMYVHLMDQAKQAGFQHYEISNFAKEGKQAVHNSGYWQEMCYLGIGPGAHSYDGHSRSWNTGNLRAYLQACGNVEAEKLIETEHLTPETRFNETIMKRLRTSVGLNINELRHTFSEEWVSEMLQVAKGHAERGFLTWDDSREALRLTRKGIFISNEIMSDLMRV